MNKWSKKVFALLSLLLILQYILFTSKPSEAWGGGAEGGGLEPSNNFYLYLAEQNTQTRKLKYKPNSDLLKKIKEPRLALSMLLAHMLQAISDSLFSSTLIDSFPDF